MATLTADHSGTPTAIARALVAGLDELTDELVAMILSGDHAYAETTLLSVDLLRSTVRDNLESVLRQLGGESATELRAARATGRMKAGVGLPLAALLHAYRLAGRLVWDHLRVACDDRPDLMPAIGAQVWAIIDDYSTAAAEEYARTIAERTQQDSELRRAELRALLDGVLDAGRLHTAALTLQLPTTGIFLVVCAETGDVAPLPEIESRLLEKNVSSYWLTEVHTRVGLLGLTPDLSPTAVHEILRHRVVGRVGVSATFTSPIEASAALRQAELAMRSLDPGASALGVYGEAAVPLLLAHSPDAARELRDAVLGPILTLPQPDGAALLDTLDAWFDCGGSLAAAAQRLHYHRNTINHRLRRVEELTGRDRSDPRAAAELYLAVRAARLLGE
jgi:hypothetical protein